LVIGQKNNFTPCPLPFALCPRINKGKGLPVGMIITFAIKRVQVYNE
jgi:hypothetical protein